MVPVKKDSYLAKYIYFIGVVFIITVAVKIYNNVSYVLNINRILRFSKYHIINFDTVSLVIQLVLGAYLLYSLMKNIRRKKAWFFLLISTFTTGTVTFTVMDRPVWSHTFASHMFLDPLLFFTSIGLVIVTHRYYKKHA